MMRHRKSIIGCALLVSSYFSGHGALAATCTVPNSIANGQVADAGKVMDNFNAVADCAQAGVTMPGSPIVGSISVFSVRKALPRVI